MGDSHKVSVQSGVTTNAEEGTAIAYATKWLMDVVDDVDAFHQVFAKSWNGKYNVYIDLKVSDEDVEKIKESDSVSYLSEMEA